MRIICLSFLFSAFIYSILLFLKADNAGKNHTKILNAIDSYIKQGNDYKTGLLLIDSMEDFDKTIFRLTDWGYKNILPKQYFELIEPYIQ